MKHRKRRSRIASSSKFVALENPSPCRMERLEDRQLLSATIDLRTPSGGKAVTVSSIGQVVNLDVWAVVTGADATATNDAFQWAMGSFLSSDVGGGAAGGTLEANLNDVFATGDPSNGTQADLDGDGDLDVGSNDNSQPDNFFVARASGLQGGHDPAPAKFLIGTVSFTVTSLKSGTSTDINFRPRDNVLAAGWAEDATAGDTNFKDPNTGTFTFGDPVVVRRDPPPTATVSAPSLTTGGGSTYSFTVKYDDNGAVKSSTFDNNDIRVTGPNGFRQLARKISVNATGDGKSRTVTYRINAPGGVWDSLDNGTYTIAIQGNQV